MVALTFKIHATADGATDDHTLAEGRCVTAVVPHKAEHYSSIPPHLRAVFFAQTKGGQSVLCVITDLTNNHLSDHPQVRLRAEGYVFLAPMSEKEKLAAHIMPRPQSLRAAG